MTDPVGGGLLSGETGAMLSFTLPAVDPTSPQASACGAMVECGRFVTEDATSLEKLSSFMTALNGRFDELSVAARQSGHEYLAANEQTRITIESVLPPRGN